jgi:hypothetical protein
MKKEISNMKWLLVLSFVFAACNNSSNPADNGTDTLAKDSTGQISKPRESPTVSETRELIVPGESIGKVKLGEEVSSLEVLGPPDLSDAAMGKAWLTWKGKRDEHNNSTELNVYTSYKDNSMKEKTVQQIRTTSSHFVTEKGIHVYSSLEEIQQSFPSSKKSASYNDDGREIEVYDDAGKGIAFEIATAGKQKICTGIIIHEANKNVNEIYIMLHPDMKKY